MDVAVEEVRLKTSAYVDEIAKALSDGIADYLSAANLESSAGTVFGDGFEAQGKKGSLPHGAGKETAKESKTSPSDRKLASSRAMNDKKEFSEVEIGAEELLFMGNSNAAGAPCSGLNSLPPANLWPRIANTAKMLDEIRHRLGASCRILSAYRSPAYNSCVGGESASLHMSFNAIDFRCASGTPAEWRDVARAVRSSKPAFKGGIGFYSSFVHIDTRGSIANWNG